LENQNGRMYFRSDPVKYCSKGGHTKGAGRVRNHNGDKTRPRRARGEQARASRGTPAFSANIFRHGIRASAGAGHITGKHGVRFIPVVNFHQIDTFVFIPF